MYFNDRHFSVSMSDFRWSHRNAPCWNDKGSEFNSPTNKPAALTTCVHMTHYHTFTRLRLRGPITCVIKDHCLSCLLTLTFTRKELTSAPPPPFPGTFQGKPDHPLAWSTYWLSQRLFSVWKHERWYLTTRCFAFTLLRLWWSWCCNPNLAGRQACLRTLCMRAMKKNKSGKSWL